MFAFQALTESCCRSTEDQCWDLILEHMGSRQGQMVYLLALCQSVLSELNCGHAFLYDANFVGIV
eukprot:1160486-Pelagomonas_calceolata.AAC.6